MSTDWVTFRHPLGLSLRHPPGWSIVHAQDALQIVPDHFDQHSEFILVRAIAAPVARIDDPSVIDYMDDSIRQVQPALRRTSDPSVARNSAGEGMVLDYSGKLADGRAGAAVVLSVLVDGSAVSLTAIATEEKMAQRKPLLAEVFATFAVGSETVDANGRDVREASEPLEFVEFGNALQPRDQQVFFGAFDPDAEPFHAHAGHPEGGAGGRLP